MTRTESSSSKSQNGTYKVLIVDDHPVVRQGLRLIINNAPEMQVCGEADCMTEAIKVFRAMNPDLVVIDVSLKDCSGIELIKELKAIDPNAKLLVWSMHDESLFAERAVRAGALGFINKEESTDRVLDAMRHVLRGKIYLSEQMTNRMLCRTLGSGEELEHSPIETLSDRELEVFEQIGHGVTTRQIAAKLDLSPKTVETYRENIKAKLNLNNATELTRHAVQWVLENK
jgi:DNA-binding NarL/FixJ family response regulator